MINSLTCTHYFYKNVEKPLNRFLENHRGNSNLIHSIALGILHLSVAPISQVTLLADTMIGVLTLPFVCLTGGKVEAITDFSLNHTKASKYFLSHLYLRGVQVLNPNQKIKYFNSYYSFPEENPNQILFQIDQDTIAKLNQNRFFQKHVVTRVNYFTFPLTSLMMRVIDTVFCLININYSILTRQKKSLREMHFVATRLNITGVIHDFSYSIIKFINPSVDLAKFRSN